YTPIELHYRHFDPDWDVRRKGADLYMLGALFAFLAANVHFFGVVLSKIPAAYHPHSWTGTYSDALPALRAATYDAITEVIAILPGQLRDDARSMLEWLCNPEPNLRGHPNTRAQRFGDPFALERIISAADLLARK